ncbi:F-box protein, partial [Endozoicomonas sp. SESOKO2]|uniref:F-box protein n=1 Tax=Endozoicomonas sp. SESOKO2 TaxID=2828743 RepID=UPI002147231C
MHFTNSHSSIDASLSSTLKQTRPEETPRGVSVSREVTVQNSIEPAFFHLPVEIHSKIIRCLDFRGVTRLAKVCKYLHTLVKQDRAVESAWFRRFPEPHQYQLKTLLTAKDDQQLCDWLKPIVNKEAVESLVKQRNNAYFPALLLFTNSQRMSQCEQFELVEKAKISQKYRIMGSKFSPDSRHVMTVADNVAKIHSQKAGGSWEEKNTICHKRFIKSANFSPDSRHLVTASPYGKAKICDLGDDGSWEEK